MTATARMPVPMFFPFEVVPQWLPRETADALLDYAIANQSRFIPSEIYIGGERKVDLERRQTRVLRELGEFRELLTQAALASKPDLERQLKIPPFDAQRMEVEVAVHGHGAHIHRHIDTFTGQYQKPSTRVLTMVYYMHREPKAFSGGALRFYSLGAPAAVNLAMQDVEPRHNQLAAFPSFAPHSVEPVVCPGNEFADNRFSVNIWIHR